MDNTEKILTLLFQYATVTLDKGLFYEITIKVEDRSAKIKNKNFNEALKDAIFTVTDMYYELARKYKHRFEYMTACKDDGYLGLPRMALV